MPKTATKEMPQSTTFTMRQKAPKVNSVLFESKDKDSCLAAIYVMREGMKQQLGIADLDKVQEIEITIKVK